MNKNITKFISDKSQEKNRDLITTQLELVAKINMYKNTQHSKVGFSHI